MKTHRIKKCETCKNLIEETEEFKRLELNVRFDSKLQNFLADIISKTTSKVKSSSVTAEKSTFPKLWKDMSKPSMRISSAPFVGSTTQARVSTLIGEEITCRRTASWKLTWKVSSIFDVGNCFNFCFVFSSTQKGSVHLWQLWNRASKSPIDSGPHLQMPSSQDIFQFISAVLRPRLLSSNTVSTKNWIFIAVDD